MKYFPIFVDLEDRAVFMGGGGEAAAQKLRLIQKTDAEIVVFAADVTGEISELEAAGHIKIERRPLAIRDLRKASNDLSVVALIYAAAEDDGENARVAAMAQEAGVPINVVDNPRLSNFITPAIVDRDPVTIAIGTEGTAPVLARSIKAQIEAMLPHSTGAVAKLAASWRDRIAARIKNPRARRLLWQRFFAIQLPKSDRAPEISATELRLKAIIDAAEAEENAQKSAGRSSVHKPGRVSIMNASLDAVGELNADGRGRLFAADIVIFDQDCAPAIRELVRREAVYFAAEDICLAEVMAREAKLGHQVVHLAGAARASSGIPFDLAQDHIATLSKSGVAVDVFNAERTSDAAIAAAFEPAFLPTADNQNDTHLGSSNVRGLQ